MIKGQLKNISVSYNKKDLILKSLNLDIHEGELLSLLGPSGCGKSTTLRTIAGFLDVVDGSFILDGDDYTRKHIHDRDFGIVFQSYALFPHLNVFDNVAFGLKLRKMDKKTILEKVSRMLEICNLTGYENRVPQQLSGGQRQRVALARALVIEPKLLLLDEPLSNLDAQLRIQMRNEIKRIQRELNITTIFVTHDQEECFAISDRVAVMKDGIIEQLDCPETIYAQPKTEYVARFVGFENFIDPMKLPYDTQNHPNTLACIRPDDIKVTQTGWLKAEVMSHEYLGNRYQLVLNTELGMLKCIHTQRIEEASSILIDLPEHKICYVQEEK
ncbi:spermidine/putrescine ABC transporter ATP-binding protein [Erysipelothrix larvae]|uniref:Spermidine/putrescine ABC transporter ATP-binding protein n=1 Tax=Erysipelothrix larvae TaxID=1514105 RepID=A0A109UH18_9FIRM|nr:ABC transporter ATP-binding protein [Erysipelothrix larvae]AMC93481.1 spermidine/putrescine ABC transporter ATP-binding protein [Erysipelothrix larvae]